MSRSPYRAPPSGRARHVRIGGPATVAALVVLGAALLGFASWLASQYAWFSIDCDRVASSCTIGEHRLLASSERAVSLSEITGAAVIEGARATGLRRTNVTLLTTRGPEPVMGDSPPIGPAAADADALASRLGAFIDGSEPSLHAELRAGGLQLVAFLLLLVGLTTGGALSVAHAVRGRPFVVAIDDERRTLTLAPRGTAPRAVPIDEIAGVVVSEVASREDRRYVVALLLRSGERVTVTPRSTIHAGALETPRRALEDALDDLRAA